MPNQAGRLAIAIFLTLAIRRWSIDSAGLGRIVDLTDAVSMCRELR